MADTAMWKCSNCHDTNPDSATVCVVCGKPRGYKPTEVVDGRVHHNRFALSGTKAKSFGANVLLVTSAIIWVVGIIATIIMIPAGILAALVSALAFGILGLFPMCLAELFQNVANIAASFESATITQTDYHAE